MADEKKKAVLYCRVSTKEQVEEGNSLVTQEKLCREYAFKHGYEAVEAFIEQGESAKTQNRPELQRLLMYCANRKNGVSAVIAYKIDRISRNTDDYSQIRVLLARYNIEIKSTTEYFEDTPAGRFMHNIIANVSQFDNDVRTERSVNGMKEAMREGRYVWHAPLGYRNVRVQGKATIIQSEIAPLVTEAFKKVAQNITASENIRKQINEKGLVISKSHFYKILRNKVYAGWIIKFGECHKGLFEPIVTDETFEAVQLVLKYKKPRSYTYRIKHPDFPLRRFVSYATGASLTGAWSKGRAKYYPYYIFKREKLIFQKYMLENEFKSFLNQFRLNECHIVQLKESVKVNLVKKNKSNIEKAAQLRKYIADLKIRQTGIIQKNLQGVISNQVLKEQLDLIEHELLTAYSSLALLPDTKIEYEQMLDSIEEYLKDPCKTWEELSLEYKLQLQWFYFPKGVTFDGLNYRTTEICKLFNAKTLFLPHNSPKVTLRDQKSNQREIPSSENTQSIKEFWEEIEKEIVFLANLQTEATAPG